MSPLIPIIQQMIIGNMGGKPVLPRISTTGILLKCMTFTLLLAGLFLAVYAEYVWLKIFLPLHLAVLTTSLTLILISVCIEFVGRILAQKKVTPDSPDIIKVVTDIIATLDEDLEGAIRANPKIAVALSTLGGFITGKKLDL